MKSQTLNNVISLAIAANFVSCMIREVGGYDIADTYKGKPLQDDVVQEIALSAISKLIKNQKEKRSLGVKEDVI